MYAVFKKDCVIVESLGLVSHILVLGQYYVLVHSLGKSTSLRLALSLYGNDNDHINGPDSNAAAVMTKACCITLPLGM